MKICMAAPYDITNSKSWSGTPLSLYSAMKEIDGNDITPFDISKYHNYFNVRANILRHLDVTDSFRSKSFVSKLGPSAMNPLNSKILNKHCASTHYDAVLEFGGFLPQKNVTPYFIYTDSSNDVKLDYFTRYGELPFGNEGISVDTFKYAADFVRKIYTNAAGVFCMSNWLAESMINTTGVSPEKMHTVYAGANWHGENPPDEITPKSILQKKEINLLITGVSYKGKGVDIAVEAVKILNRESDIRYNLHVCGISEPYPKNEFVIDYGFINKSKLIELLNLCDVFVLPSRFDCFGIAFVEAMTFGLPCVGRNICAMPEIIDRGVNGELVDSDDPTELAELIAKICTPQLYSKYSESAIKKSQKFTWERVAQDITNVIRK
ncbi:MAG: glycosyltransferase family 4 protein [Clostridia bacterium]|nr:glycosyltransferase family 4 protein [Clostridia bacterium]